MISYLKTHWFRQAWHPAERELLLYVNGELPARSTERIRAHLQGCWSCSTWHDKIKYSIAIFMEYRNQALGGPAAFPPEAQMRFETQLGWLASQTNERSPLTLRLDSIRQICFQSAVFFPLAAACLVILLVGLFAWMWLTSVPQVSAQEILQRTGTAEVMRIQRVPRPVVYQKIRVRRGETSARPVTWEIWDDEGHHQHSQRVEDDQGLRFVRSSTEGRDDLDSRSFPPVLTELNQILKSNRMDSRRPISSAGYESWRKSIQLQSEFVRDVQTPEGGRALKLETAAQGPFQPNAIVKAELVVRTEDWHPVEQRLRVQQEGGTVDYELNEAAYEVIALNTLPAIVFGDLAVPPPAVALPRSPAQADAQFPSTATLLTAEIEAWYGLHLVKACAGEPVSVARASRNRIEVRGVVTTAERKTELLAALMGIPLTSVKIHTTAEDWAAAASSSRTKNQNEAGFVDSSVGKLAPIELQSGKLATQDLLEQYFARQERVADPGQKEQETHEKNVRQKVAALSQEAVSLSESALEQAWALRRLAEWDQSWTTGQLPVSAQRLLALMVTDHLSTLKAELNQSRSLLEPVLFSWLTNAASLPLESEEKDSPRVQQPENANWTEQSSRLFATVEETKHLTLSLFANTSSPAKDATSAMRALLSAFGSLQEEFEVLDLQVSQQLLRGLDLITSKRGSELNRSQSPSPYFPKEQTNRE